MSHAALMLLCSLAVAVSADAPRTIHDYTRETGPRMNTNMPRHPLSAVHLEQWAEVLGASEAQVLFMSVMYARFVDRYNAYMDGKMPAYLALAADLSALRREAGLNSPEFARFGKRLDRESQRIRRELTAIEHSFIDSFHHVLTDLQRDRVTILRHEATRRNCRVYRCFARWADVELREVWRGAARALASPEETERVEEILAEYEARLTPLICRRADLLFERRSRLRDNRIAREQGTITLAAARERYASIMSRRAHIGREVRLLHECTLPRIAAVLHDEAASAFFAGAKRAAFPELYPDPVLLDGLFAALFNDAELLADRDLIAAIAAEYSARSETANRKLEELCIVWGERRSEGVDGYLPQDLPAALHPLLEARIQLSRDMLSRLDETLSPDWRERHAAAVPRTLRLNVDRVDSENPPRVRAPAHVPQRGLN